jgi:uncharacterized membrane protein YkoI
MRHARTFFDLMLGNSRSDLMMNSKAILATVAMAVAMSMAQADNAKADLQALSSVKLSLTDAIKMAEKEGNGKAIDAELESASSAHPEYAVEVLSNDGKKLTEYKLDANTGKIAAAKNEPFEKVFTRLKPQDVESAQTSLASAVASAERQTGGKVIDAETERSGSQVRYDMKIAKADGSTEKVKIDGATGKVASK